jgi:nitrate/nitrite transporter NarK
VRFDPKRTYIGYLIGAVIAVPVFASVRDAHALLIAGPIAGFFGTGYFSGFGVITAVLFPTRIRGTALGFVYNIGRVASAAAPYLIGLVSETSGFSFVLSLTSGAFLLAAILASFLRLPEATELENVA